MVRVLRGGERSEERLQLRPCVSFGHSCCETGLTVPGNQPVVCISIMLPCGSSSPLSLTLHLLFLGLGLPSMYLCDWPQQSPAACFRLYFTFVSQFRFQLCHRRSRHTKVHRANRTQDESEKKQNKILFEGFSGREGKAESVGTLSDYVQQGVDSQIKRNRIHRYSMCIENSLFQAHL